MEDNIEFAKQQTFKNNDVDPRNKICKQIKLVGVVKEWDSIYSF